uniref:Mitochondrial fission factor n=1 Tax=Ciona savignyi TaxID=51511 RepID=H2Z159_CIOSA
MNGPANGNDMHDQYYEDINAKMTVPSKLSALQENDDGYQYYQQTSNFSSDHETYIANNPALRMEVPERIVVSVGETGSKFSAGDARSSSPVYNTAYTSATTVSLATPPRILTVQDSPLYRQPEEPESSDRGPESPGSLVGHSDQMALTDYSSIEDLDEASLMRKQIFKLHRRVTALEQQQLEMKKVNYCVYGLTVAFWLINGWFLYTHRRLY